jgi:hypothetical protein
LANPLQIDDFIAFIDQHLAEENELLLVVSPEHEEQCVRHSS